jgi:hypothetical protein
MDTIQTLEKERATWVDKKVELQEASNKIGATEQALLQNNLLPLFSNFIEQGVKIEVRRGGIYFTMDHPDYTYGKELFTLYLQENWHYADDDVQSAFKGLDLSYYSTQTKGDNVWELLRLSLLGELAGIVRWKQVEILDIVNETVKGFREERDRLYEQMNLVGKAINDLDIKIRQLEKKRVEFELKGDGVTFTKGVSVQMKYNYTPKIQSIKLIDFSKSGKKATAVFTFAHGTLTSREENVSVESIVDQVSMLSQHIKDTSEEKLLAPQ